MVFNPHGVPGVIVPFHVVEEHLNVIERAQILPQVTEERMYWVNESYTTLQHPSLSK